MIFLDELDLPKEGLILETSEIGNQSVQTLTFTIPDVPTRRKRGLVPEATFMESSPYFVIVNSKLSLPFEKYKNTCMTFHIFTKRNIFLDFLVASLEVNRLFNGACSQKRKCAHRRIDQGGKNENGGVVFPDSIVNKVALPILADKSSTTLLPFSE